MKKFFLIAIAFALAACASAGTESPAESDAEVAGPTGSIYFIQRPENGTQKIMRTILPQGQTDEVFAAPELSQIHELDVSADGNTLIFSQTPPPSVNNGIFDRTLLRTIDLGDPAGEAALLLGGDLPNEFYNMPIFSPDGRYLFYSRLGPDRIGITGTDTFYGIERYDLESGETTPIVPNSIWPQLSPDGSKVLFIILDLPTQQRGLGIVNSDGTEPELLIDIGRYFDIDSPIFAPDGESVYLSIVETQPPASLLDRLMGVSVAYAHTEHNIPSTWWQLPLDGGEPTPLNTEEVILINGRFHPAENKMALATTTGIQLLDLDSETLSYEPLANEPGLGMLDWVVNE